MNHRKSTPVSIAALGLLAAAAPAAMAAEDATDVEQDQELDEVIVTGSRIARAADETPNPVLSITQEELRYTGLVNLSETLAHFPALVASGTRFDFAGSSAPIGLSGVNLLDLRNLGTDRTLVLVNGRRHIGGVPGSAAVDVNTLPVDLIQSVDVLTGGVSAIYGADGVSGVVNFITRRDFEGLVLRGQGSLSGRGDGGQRFFSLTSGENFADGRGNVTLSYEFAADDAVHATDRPRAGDPMRAWGLVRNPDDPDDNPDLYDYIPLNNLRYFNSALNGAVDTDWDFLADFTGTGESYDHGVVLNDRGLTYGGSGTPQAGFGGDLQTKMRRHVANIFSSYQLNDSVRLFAEGKYVHGRTWNSHQPSWDDPVYIAMDNPFIPDVIRDAVEPGVGGGLGLPDGVLVFRDNLDLGRRQEVNTRQTLRSVLGIDGRIGGIGPRYEVSYTFGQSRFRSVNPNHRVDERHYAALDAVDEGEYLTGTPNGNIVCRIDLEPEGTPINLVNWGEVPQTFTPGPNSGCVPVNPFGYGQDPAAVDFVGLDVATRTRMTQHVVSAWLSGDLNRYFTLPAGDVEWAAGLEYRKEKSRSTPDQMIQDGLMWGIPQIAPDSGHFDVGEAFVEVSVPVLRNAPLADSLDVGGALRVSDYSTVGKTTTWKLDARWAPVRDIAFRATYSEAVRAPNISELFTPESGTFEFIDDPCDAAFIGQGSQYRADNCAQMLADLGIDPEDFNPSEYSTNLPGRLKGNPDLMEETAKSWTVGFVYRPVALPDLKVTFDWYDVRLRNAVSTPTAQQMADLCFDQPTLDNTFCEGITRDPTTGYIDDFLLWPQNVSRFTTAGADLTVNYSFSPWPNLGRFEWKLTGGYLDELTFIATPGAEVTDNRGDMWAPKYTAATDLTWRRASWAVNYGINYFSRTRRFTEAEKRADPDIADPKYFYYSAKWVHDLHASYTMPDHDLEMYVGVNNLFNRQPDFPGVNYPVGFMGRYFYGGVRFALGR